MLRFEYDQSTDSLYIAISDSPAEDTRIIDDELAIDYGADGHVVGYDLQTASRHGERIVAILRASRGEASPELLSA